MRPSDALARAAKQRRILLGRRSLRRRPKRAAYPWAAERKYLRVILTYVAVFQHLVQTILIPQLSSIADEAALLRPDRADDWTDRLGGLFVNMRLRMEEAFGDVDYAARDVGIDISNFNKKEFLGQLRSALGVDVLQHEPYLQPQLNAFVKQNVALIKSIPSNEFDKIEQIAMQGFRTSRRPEDIAKEIQGRFSVSKSRAALIARDQTGKLNGQLSMLRQKDVGVNSYIWRTVGDERVRPTHAIKEGRVFSWDKPPADTGHPGEDYQCRCHAEPILSDTVFGDLFGDKGD